MNRKQFYLTLPSNSSTNYYKDNKAENYITHLPRTIQLDGGEWEVALVEAHYPSTFRTLGEGEHIRFTIEDPKVTPPLKSEFTFNLQPGNYDTVDALLQYINNYERIKNLKIKFTINPTTGLLSIKDPRTDGTSKMVYTTTKLGRLLGLDDVPDKPMSIVRAPNINNNKPSQMYVYCDLVDPQLVGDTVAPLLRIVNIDTQNTPYGATKTVHFHDPHYVPVLKSTFDTVEIDLRDDKGEHLPFRFGTSCMKLHFRRATSS